MKNQIHYDLVVEFEVLLDSELETIRGGVSTSDPGLDTTTEEIDFSDFKPSKPKPIPLPYPEVPENIPGLPTKYVK